MKRKGVFYYKPATKKQQVARPVAPPRTAIIQRAPAYQQSARREEAKAVDTNATAINFANTAATFIALNTPVNGSAYFNRMGSKIRMNSVYIAGNVTPTGSNSAAVQEDYGRLMLVYDRQSNATQPPIASILSSINTGGTVSSTSYDHMNLQNRDRFLMLRDERINLPAIGIAGAVPSNTSTFQSADPEDAKLNVKMFVPLKGLEAHYNQVNGGTYADLTTGTLWLIAFAFYATAANPAYQFEFGARVKYYDA